MTVIDPGHPRPGARLTGEELTARYDLAIPISPSFGRIRAAMRAA